MRWFKIFMFFCLVCGAASKTAAKALTESMGQEVVEIRGPVKDLPQGLEEEPSAETDDEDDKETTTTLMPATKKETHKTSAAITRRKMKDIDKIDRAQEDDEARIEKELAELYKDNADYKSEPSAEIVKQVTNKTSLRAGSKSAGRADSFKFQPDNGVNVERWRTSIDEISCDKRVTRKLTKEESKQPLNEDITIEPATEDTASAVASSIDKLLVCLVLYLGLVN